MKRREFITLLGGAAAAWPLGARAQQSERVRHIGVLMYMPADDAEGQARLAAFTQALKQLGWSDGRNRGSTPAGLMPTTFTGTRRSWPRSRRTSSWAVLAPQLQRRCCRQPAPCQLCSSLSSTRSAPVSSRAWHSRAQRDRVHDFRIRHERKMAGTAQRDRATRDAGGGPSGSCRRIGDRAVRRCPGRGPVGGDRVETGRRARCRRDRARRHGIRGEVKWRPDRDGNRISIRSSRPDYLAGEPASIARGLLASPLRRRRWAWSLMAPTRSTRSDTRRATSIASSKARSRPTCRSRRRPSTNG
jgi:hypothetical protein